MERGLAIAIWIAAAFGIVWIARHPVTEPLIAVSLYASAAFFWIPLLAATAHAPFWVTRWVNRRTRGNPRFRLTDLPGRVPPAGRYLSMEIDPREPVSRETILRSTRQICASTAVVAFLSVALLLLGWLILRQPWMFASACAFAALLAWEIYPRRAGVRYRTGWTDTDSVARSLCLGALGKALQEQTSIRDWHPEYFDIIRRPSDGLIEEHNAASWIHTYALLKGDLETAARYIERRLALLPEDAPVTQYIGLGSALHFYTVAAPDESRRKLLLQRISNIGWDLRPRDEYVAAYGAAIALAEGRRAEAFSIAQARLDRIGSEGGSAQVQLERELLTRCRDSVA